MGQRHIDERTIITDSFAPFGEIVTGPPDRPDKTADERAREKRAGEITEGELLAARGWTLENLALARRHGFPVPRTTSLVSRFSFRVTTTNVCSRAAFAEWDRNVRGLLRV